LPQRHGQPGPNAEPPARRRPAELPLIIGDQHRLPGAYRPPARAELQVEDRALAGGGQEALDLVEDAARFVPARDAAVVGPDQLDRTLEQNAQHAVGVGLGRAAPGHPQDRLAPLRAVPGLA
jgi:hypothetical protein